MKLQHYLGGLEGLGPVSTETRVFVEPWETRIFGIHTAMMALSPQLPLPKTPSAFNTVWTWADLRKGAESLNPFDYFKYRYYEKWLGGISGYFIGKGYITAAELDALTEEYYKKHTRLPGFLRNKAGTIETVYEGAYTYLCETGPDGLGTAMPVYCVRFQPNEIWPDNAEPNFSIHADLYACYLEAPAAAAPAKAA
jgi:hypothetical protein